MHPLFFKVLSFFTFSIKNDASNPMDNKDKRYNDNSDFCSDNGQDDENISEPDYWHAMT